VLEYSEQMQGVDPKDIEFMRRACLLCDNSVLEVRTGCVIVSGDGVVLGEGWNCSSSKESLHAESMALEKLEQNENLAVCSLSSITVYVTRFPCEACAKKLIQTGISKLFYMSDHFSSGNSALLLFKTSNIPVTQIPETRVWDKIVV